MYVVLLSFVKQRILDAVCRWPGSAHDSTIFTHSRLFRRLQNYEFGQDVVVLADSGYGSEQFICKPLRNVETEADNSYQIAQIHTRNVVERTIGTLKERFQCLLNGSFFKKPYFFQDVILSCCILHNMIMEAEGTVIVEYNEQDIDFQRNLGAAYMQSGENRIQNYLVNNHFH